MWRHKKWVISPLSNEKWACERVRHLSRLQDVLSSRFEEDSLETFHSVRLWTLNGKTKRMTLREAEGEKCAAGLTRKVPFQLPKGPKIFFSGWIYEGRRCVSLAPRFTNMCLSNRNKLKMASKAQFITTTIRLYPAECAFQSTGDSIERKILARQ